MTLDYDVVCLSHLRWDFVYQRPQHLLSRYAREHRVFFVEEPYYDAEEPFLEIRVDQPQLRVVIPHLPEHVLTLGDGAAEAGQAALIDRLFRQYAIVDYILWYYTPTALSFTCHLHGLATIYDCMDELSAFAHAPSRLAYDESQLFRRADLVFTGGHSLFEAKRDRHPHVHVFPSSVDITHFARARTPLPERVDQARIPRPRIGFFGVIDERMDLQLLADVADLRSHWHFVIVGPVAKINRASLPQRANIHYLGSKPYAQLPAYLSSWDVAIMPFALNAATRYISPTKTLEYLAAGKPVVSTSVPDVVSNFGGRGIVRLADDPSAFVAAIEAALCEDPSLRWPRIDALLAETSWERTWTRMAELIDREIVARASSGGGARHRGEVISQCSTT